MLRRPRRKGGTLKDGERRQLARSSRHGAPALPSAPADRPLLLCDGGSRGNPGTAAIAAVLVDRTGVLAQRAESIGHAGAAEAEYRAIVLGLALAAEHDLQRLEVRCDSQLAVDAIRTGAPAAAAVLEAAEPFDVRWRWHPRTENSLADALVRDLLWPR